jgi:hypothetical protein
VSAEPPADPERIRVVREGEPHAVDAQPAVLATGCAQVDLGVDHLALEAVDGLAADADVAGKARLVELVSERTGHFTLDANSLPAIDQLWVR